MMTTLGLLHTRHVAPKQVAVVSPDTDEGIMAKMNVNRIGNALLILGVFMLVVWGAVELAGHAADPLWPATSALLVGCTAMLDRVGAPRLRRD